MKGPTRRVAVMKLTVIFALIIGQVASREEDNMRGLLLIEVLIIIAILGVLAAIVIPNLSRLLEW